MLQTSPYKSLTQQTLHYFARPHEGIRTSPLTGPAAWRGAELRDKPEQWTHILSDTEIDEIRAAVSYARSLNKATRDLTRADFPLPGLLSQCRQWQATLSTGLGFQLIRGVPVDEWSAQEQEIFFWCFGLHIGVPGMQNPQGDLLGHVLDLREKDGANSGRFYKTAKNIAFHCDAADVVGLLCLRKAKNGGHSRIVSSVSLYNDILTQHPELVPRLYEPFQLDTHGENGLQTIAIEPCRYAAGQLKTFYHCDYFNSAFAYEHIDAPSAEESRILELFETLAGQADNYLDMDLQPGDIQLVSNHTVLHARTEYEDFEPPEQRRHLLRLWLSLPQEGRIRQKLLGLKSKLQLIRRLAWQKLSQ